MNRQPPLPPIERLDAEERALAALLPRQHGRSEPGADLDASILAAARAATEPAKARPVPARRRSWIAPTAVAASLVLAVGLAWQLRPPPALDAPAAGTAADATRAGAAGDAMTVQAIEAPPPPAAVATPMPQEAQMKPAPPPAESLPSAGFARAAARRSAPAEPELVAAPPPPAPPAPPASPAPVVADSPAPASMAAAQIAAPARAQAPMMAKSAARSGEIARERAADNDAAQAQDAAAMAANATTLDTVTIGDDPGEDVPPATADSPEVRDAWLRRIGELLNQGKHEDAKASLAEFRRRYPDAKLPPDLRKLEH